MARASRNSASCVASGQRTARQDSESKPCGADVGQEHSKHGARRSSRVHCRMSWQWRERERENKKRTLRTAGSSMPATRPLSSLRIALAATPVVADLKSCFGKKRAEGAVRQRGQKGERKSDMSSMTNGTQQGDPVGRLQRQNSLA